MPTIDPLIWYDREGRETDCVLRDMWGPDKAGFLVCAGPSLNELPTERLAERGIVSLAVNNVAGYVPVRAVTFSDPPTKICHDILLDPAILKLVPREKLRQRFRVRDPETGHFRTSRRRVRELPSVFAFRRSTEFIPEDFLISNSATWGQSKAAEQKTGRIHTYSTMLLGLRLLHYLGIRRVYLLGVDFAMTEGHRGRHAGNYAFPQAGAPGGNNNAYRILSGWFAELKPIFDRRGFEIYNCNAHSRLTVFPHVPFERALEDCRHPVGAGPLDLAGWYEKEAGEKGREDSGFDPDRT